MTDFHSLSRSFQKKMARTKEKVLMTFGKADKTTDEDFEVLSKSFNYQQVTANKLLRHFKAYAQQVKAMSAASKNMHWAMCEAYEAGWDGSENFTATTEQLTTLWENHHMQVSDFLNFQIASYACKFPELKSKIEKRSRKLLDYDRTRHKVDGMECSKKRDDAKLNETIRELDAAQTIYESINNELFEELPNLHENRIPLLSKFFNSFLKVECTFEEESAKLKRSLMEVNSVLPKEPSKLNKKAFSNLRAKTLPRREPSKAYMNSRYSPQSSKSNKLLQGDDRRKTMPARPLSPPFPSRFLSQHHPPAPTEPAPVPPLAASASSSSTSNEITSSSSKFGFASGTGQPALSSKQAHAKESVTSNVTNNAHHPSKPPQPKVSYSANQFSPPKFGHINQNPSACYSTPTSALPARWGDEKYANTRDIINYIPQLTAPASTSAPPSSSINTTSSINSNVSVSGPAQQGVKADIPGFKDITEAPQEATQLLQNASNESKKIIENIYTNVSSTASAVATKATDSASAASDALDKSIETAVKTGQEVIEAKKHVADCVSPGTMTSCTTIQVSDVPDDAKKCPDDVTATSSSASVTEVTSTTTTVKTINSPSSEKGIVVTNETISSILLPTSSYLFKVQATNNYKAADTDELSLEAGDVIYVLPIENIDLEDEGWALGLKQKDGNKGMFPVNFTRKIV